MEATLSCTAGTTSWISSIRSGRLRGRNGGKEFSLLLFTPAILTCSPGFYWEEPSRWSIRSKMTINLQAKFLHHSEQRSHKPEGAWTWGKSSLARKFSAATAAHTAELSKKPLQPQGNNSAWVQKYSKGSILDKPNVSWWVPPWGIYRWETHCSKSSSDQAFSLQAHWYKFGAWRLTHKLWTSMIVD